jgi:cytochrome subunit of sulfide dehydrogenase
MHVQQSSCAKGAAIKRLSTRVTRRIMKTLLLPTLLAAFIIGIAASVDAQTSTTPATPAAPAVTKPATLPPGAGGAPPLPAAATPTSAAPAAIPAPPGPAFAASNLTPLGVRSMAATCASCHGTNGVSVGGAVAGLAGLNKEYFVTQMKLFREGKREATLMHQISKGYTEAEINAMADYFAAQKR